VAFLLNLLRVKKTRADLTPIDVIISLLPPHKALASNIQCQKEENEYFKVIVNRKQLF